MRPGYGKWRLMVGGLAVFALVGAACGDDDDTTSDETDTSNTTAVSTEFTPELEAILADARTEGDTLNWTYYFSGGDPLIEALNEGFNEFYDLDVTFQGTFGQSINQDFIKMKEELAAGQPPSTDVAHAAPNALALNPEVFETVDWSFAPWIPEEAIIADGLSLYMNSRLPGMIYNTDEVDEADLPETFAEYAEVTDFDIATSARGTSTGPLGTEGMMGEEEFLEVMRTLADNVEGFMECGEADPKIILNEFDMFAMDCGVHEVLLAPEGAPLGHHIFSDAAVIAYQTVGVTVETEKPNLTRLLAAFMLSPEGQEIMYEGQGADFHKLDGSQTAELIAEEEAAGVEFLEEDYDFAEENAEFSARIRPMVQEILRS